MWQAILNNPARIVAVAVALLAVLQAAKVPITAELGESLVTLIEAVLAALAAVFTGEAVRANINGPVTAKRLAAANDNSKKEAA